MTETVHEIKCWPEFFDAVKRGDKTFELRKNDRGFQRGDIIVLRRFDPNEGLPRYNPMTWEQLGHHGSYTPDVPPLRLRVTYVLASAHLKEGHVALGFRTEPAE